MEFILYFTRLALNLLNKTKLGGASEIKINGIYFVFHSACTKFAEKFSNSS